MRYNDAFATLERQLTEAGLSADALEPWRTWKVFKAFMRIPFDDVVDDGTVKYSISENEEGIYEAYLYLVLEFSVPRVDESEPLGQMGFEFVFDSQVIETIEPGEFWTQDAPTGCVPKSVDIQVMASGNRLTPPRSSMG